MGSTATDQQETKAQIAEPSPGFIERTNRGLIQYFGTYHGREMFMILALTCCPLIVVGQGAVTFQYIAGHVGPFALFLSAFLSAFTVALFARRISHYMEMGPLYRRTVQVQQRQVKEEQEKAPYQEFRAQGQRVVVDGVAFQYGQSRKFFERAPWYRN